MDILGIISDVLFNGFALVFSLIEMIVSVILYPFNIAMYGLFPDFADQIGDFMSGINVMIENSAWALSILPSTLIITLVFTYGFRYAVLGTVISQKMILKVWSVLQKVKFW